MEFKTKGYPKGDEIALHVVRGILKTSLEDIFKDKRSLTRITNLALNKQNLSFTRITNKPLIPKSKKWVDSEIINYEIRKLQNQIDCLNSTKRTFETFCC